jgi:hypothetical protein
MNGERKLVSRAMLDALFIIQIILNILVLAVIISLLYLAIVQINKVNDRQLCGQYASTKALKSIGRSIGVPVRNIPLPDISGVDCGH